ncbi:hypothetical protein NQZ68_001698 [Dissostichus eleginoides]|nr:hypothetical protein NQZ68_001698 [Dissostichus eleginoides]
MGPEEPPLSYKKDFKQGQLANLVLSKGGFVTVPAPSLLNLRPQQANDLPTSQADPFGYNDQIPIPGVEPGPPG